MGRIKDQVILEDEARARELTACSMCGTPVVLEPSEPRFCDACAVEGFVLDLDEEGFT